MSLDEAVNAAPRVSYDESPRDYGVAVLKDERGSSVVFDRAKRKFVKARPHILARSRQSSVDSRSGFLGKFKDTCEAVTDFVAKGYQHGRDLVDIARKHGLKAALQYEAEVFKQDFRNAKFAIQLAYAMTIDQMSVDNTRVASAPFYQPPAVVQIDNPRNPQPETGLLDLDSFDYSRFREGGDDLICINSLGPQRGTDPQYDLAGLLKEFYRDQQKGD